MPKYLIIQDPASGRTHEIDLPCVIGRGPHADLSLSDTSISHRHAFVSEVDGNVWIKDLESANGVCVNENRIRGQSVLREGDSVKLGRVTLLISGIMDNLFQETLVIQSVDPKAEWKLDREKLRFIYEITAELSDSQDIATLGQTVFSKFKSFFKQDRGYLALFQEDGSLRPVFLDFSLKEAPISKSIVNRLLQSGESFLLEDALSESSFKEQESVVALRIRSALCVPLIYHSQIYGLIYLDRNVPGAYKQDHLDFLRAVAFILAPLMENARLWSELQQHYAKALETLKETQARLLEMERTAAYVRLAQSLAHEIRNPLMTIGGLVRRIARSAPEGPDSTKCQAVLGAVQRIETVLKEVDDFVRIPLPQKKLERIDLLVEEELAGFAAEWEKAGVTPALRVEASQTMVPVDAVLFRKAFSMMIREAVPSISQGSRLEVSIRDCGNDIEILVGPETDGPVRLCETSDPELQTKPWSLGLFLNMAHKIIADHGGKLFLDPRSNAAFPILIRLPRMVSFHP
ncbi:MAG: FHA domain-containing protein [Pseudomonadota bacterium]